MDSFFSLLYLNIGLVANESLYVSLTDSEEEEEEVEEVPATITANGIISYLEILNLGRDYLLLLFVLLIIGNIEFYFQGMLPRPWQNQRPSLQR